MPLDPRELLRGKIVWAVFPFAPQFPATAFDESGQRVTYSSVDEYAKARKGAPTEFVSEARLRPVLLLHDGTRGDHDDVACLRVNTVKAKHRQHTSAWGRIVAHEHPFFFHLPTAGAYGLTEESIIDLTSIGVLHKDSIAAIRPRGGLNPHEMQIVSERLARALSLDLAPLVAAQANKLLAAAGIKP